MTNFADRLNERIASTGTPLIAGLDPVLETIPSCFLRAGGATGSDEEHLYGALTGFYAAVLPSLAPLVAAVKPNSAFFEQYGLGGIRALFWLRGICKDLDLPLILDAKRGDIGSTAAAYSAAYLGRPAGSGARPGGYDADAMTVNPFLGLETLEPFLRDAEEFGKGVFVLVRTSNPGSSDFQTTGAPGATASDRIAEWIETNGAGLVGRCGYSSLGAVVGATHPQEARRLRASMPRALFLVPGFGSQGGAAPDAVAGFDGKGAGAVVNASRALMSSFSSLDIDRETAVREVSDRAASLARDLGRALVDRTSEP